MGNQWSDQAKHQTRAETYGISDHGIDQDEADLNVGTSSVQTSIRRDSRHDPTTVRTDGIYVRQRSGQGIS